MAKSGITVNSKDFKRQARAVAKRYGFEVKAVMTHQTGLWGADLAKNTWPKKKGTATVISTGGGKPKTLAGAIANDIKRAFRIVDNTRKNARQDLSAHLRQARNGTTGKVSKKYRRGGSEFRPVISKAEAKRLMTTQLKLAGQVQSGWAPMIQKFKGKMPAQWIRTGPGSSRGKGSAVDRMKPNGSGYMEGINKVRWAKRMTRGVLAFTAKKRQRDLSRQLKTGLGRTIEFANKQKAQRVA